MKPAKVTFETREVRTTQAKVVRNKVRVMLGDSEEVFPKEALDECVTNYVNRHLRRPQLQIVKVGDEVRVVVSHGGYTEIFRPDREGDGVVGACHTTSTGESLSDAAESVALHLAQITSKNYDEVPHWLPVSKVSDYQSWCRYQREYQRT